MTAKDEANDANGELPTVIQPGKAPDLQAMVRDALRKNGIDPTTGSAPKVPLQQPRTMPMPHRPGQVPGVRVQSTPKAPAAASPAKAVAQATPPATAAPAPPKKRSSAVALITMGAFALAAAGGAVWVARNKAQLPIAAASPQAAPQPTTTESAVGFVVAPRPGENAPSDPKPETKPAETTPPATAAAPPPPPPATFTPEPKSPPKESAPSPPTTHAAKEATPPPTHAAPKAPPVAAKPAEEPKPKPAAAPPPEPKKPPEKTASAEKTAPTPPAPPPPAPGGSVDAILQQQLKSAIP